MGGVEKACEGEGVREVGGENEREEGKRLRETNI